MGARTEMVRVTLLMRLSDLPTVLGAVSGTAKFVGAEPVEAAEALPQQRRRRESHRAEITRGEQVVLDAMEEGVVYRNADLASALTAFRLNPTSASAMLSTLRNKGLVERVGESQWRRVTK